MMQNILAISLSVSVVILLLLLVSPFLNKRYHTKLWYWVWLVLALRLVIPFKPHIAKAPVTIPTPANIYFYLDSETLQLSIAPANEPISESVAEYTSKHITLQQITFTLWAIGASAFFLFHIIGNITFRKRIEKYCTPNHTSILQEICTEIQIKAVPVLYVCSQIASPMMIGFFKPTILLPDIPYTDNELKMILRHELIHYIRGDLWYKLLLVLANSVHFFNPIVYWMKKQANRDLEYSCDDAVILNEDLNMRKQYALTILRTMEAQEALPSNPKGGYDNE